ARRVLVFEGRRPGQHRGAVSAGADLGGGRRQFSSRSDRGLQMGGAGGQKQRCVGNRGRRSRKPAGQGPQFVRARGGKDRAAKWTEALTKKNEPAATAATPAPAPNPPIQR